MSSLQPLAEEHHTRCVKLLIELDSENELVSGGIALAATCLLRSYEILSGTSLIRKQPYARLEIPTDNE